jgi:hypothetical protein
VPALKTAAPSASGTVPLTFFPFFIMVQMLDFIADHFRSCTSIKHEKQNGGHCPQEQVAQDESEECQIVGRCY